MIEVEALLAKLGAADKNPLRSYSTNVV